MKFIADMHTHTMASTHAYSTVTENAAWAGKHGIKYLGMTDHGPDIQDSPDTWHFENLRILPDHIEGVRVFKGIEANILDSSGRTDIKSEVEERYYSILEWVNVSIHISCFSPLTKSEHTKTYLNMLKNKYVDVICHSEDAKFDYDFDEVAKACADAGRLIEINEFRLTKFPERTDRYRLILEACAKHGTSVIVNSDAHFYTQIGNFEKADKLLTEMGFPEELVINADEQRFLGYIKRRTERTGKQCTI